MIKKDFVWDFDGTLVDSYPLTIDAFQKALKTYNIEMSSHDIKVLMEKKIYNAIQYVKENYDVDDGFENEFYREVSKIDLTKIEPYENTEVVLKYIIDNGGSNYLFTHRNISSIKVLEIRGLLKYFKDCLTEESKLKSKPDPEAILYLINKYSIDPKDMLIIGDRELEMKMGANCGVDTCLYASGITTPETPATFTVKSMNELLNIIK